MIDLTTLETLVWIAKLGTFQSAAKKLHITQPAISARIAMLERDLGVKLFERNRQRVTLTPKGKELLPCAEQMLALRDEIRRRANQRVAVRGQLRLGVSETLVHLWFAQLAERINELFPLLELEIEVDITSNLSRALRKRQIDVAFLVGPVTDPDIKSVSLVSYPLAWIASTKLKLPREPVSLSVIAQRPMITYLQNTQPHEILEEALARENLTHGRLYGSASVSTMITMMLDGLGIGVLPAVLVSRELRAKQLRKLSVRDVRLPELSFVAAYPTRSMNFVAAEVAGLAREVALDAKSAQD